MGEYVAHHGVRAARGNPVLGRCPAGDTRGKRGPRLV